MYLKYLDPETKVLQLLLVYGLISLACVQANNKTLASKENDLSDITVEENFGESTVEKSKRHLPKVQSVVIDILKVSEIPVA